MIDVWGVLFNFLWILGLSVLLATWSYAYYERIGGWNCPTARAQHEGHKTRHILERFGYALALDAGLLLFCAGLAATEDRWWARLLWIGLGLGWVIDAGAHIRHRFDKETIQNRFWAPVYDRLAPVYDAVDWFTGNTTHRLRRRALPYLPPTGSRVLEIGFGSGRLHLELAEDYQMAGVDRAPGMVRLTARRLARRGLASTLQVASADALPWPDATFDAVLSTFAFSAFPDANKAMDEMARVLKPGGRAIIVDAGKALNGNRMAHFLASLWEVMGDYMRDEVPLMEARGLSVQREDYGPWHSVHVTVGTKPER